MGAISMNLPAIYLPAGPMLRGNWNGQPLGSGTDLWKFWAERCAGDHHATKNGTAMEAGIARSPGFCMTMGTASTMTALAEALGMTLPGASSIPAPDSNHVRMAMNCGERIVEMVWEDLKPSDILDAWRRFENAITVDMAIGGSTNAIIHLVALARRLRARTAAADVRRNLAARAGARQYPPFRRVPDGRFLLRRRPARADGGDPRSAAPGLRAR